MFGLTHVTSGTRREPSFPTLAGSQYLYARALAWNRVFLAIGFEFSDARAVELKSADRGTKFY